MRSARIQTIGAMVALFTLGAILIASTGSAGEQYPSPTPTTPTTQPTTPTTQPTSVSPAVSPTVVEEQGGSPTVAGEEVGEAGPAGAQEGEVAFTGAELTVLLLVLAALIGLGLGLYVLGRRRARPTR